MSDEHLDFQAPFFHLLQDEALRQNACEAVDLFVKDHTPVKNAQLHAIPIVIQAKGLSGLEALIENQKTKNTKKDNKAFWEFMWELISANPGPPFSLRHFLQNQAPIMAMLRDEASAPGKIEQKQARKANKAFINDIMGYVLPIYFEHFNSHYFYVTRQGA